MNIHQFIFNARHDCSSGAPIETAVEETSEAQQMTRDLDEMQGGRSSEFLSVRD
jgi:hypothetical protein